jgi:hypothetical protein
MGDDMFVYSFSHLIPVLIVCRLQLLDTARVFPPEYPFAVMGVIQLGTTPLKETGFLARIDVDRRQLLELTSGMQLRKTNEGILYFQGLGDLNRAASLLAGEPIRGSAYILYGVEGRILYYQLRAEFVKKYKSPLSSDAVRRIIAKSCLIQLLTNLGKLQSAQDSV